MDLSIIIVNFNTFNITYNCIESLKTYIKNIKWEVVIVDNGSINDNREAYIRLLPDIVYLRSYENLGFGKANNLGIARATGKYILLLNSDTLVFDDSIEKCYNFMETDKLKEVGLLGCKLINEDRTFQPSFYPFCRNNIFNFLLTNNWFFNKVFKVNKLFRETNKILKVGDVSGAFMLLRKEVVEELRAFDPDFFLYCEETEWCRERIAKHYKIIYYPKASVVHLGGKSAPKEPMYVQSKLSLALLWYKKGWLNYIMFLLASYTNQLTNLILLPFLQKESKKLILMEVNSYFKIFPYLFTEVIKFKKEWGARKEPLIYEGAREIFFPEVKKAMVKTL